MNFSLMNPMFWLMVGAAGCNMWANIPLIPKIKIKKVTEEIIDIATNESILQDQEVNKEIDKLYQKIAETELDEEVDFWDSEEYQSLKSKMIYPNYPTSPRKCLRIEFEYVDDYYHQTYHDELEIIDYDTNPVVSNSFNTSINQFISSLGIRGGSGELGVFLLSLPLTLPLSPVLLVINGFYRLFEKISGINRRFAKLIKQFKKSGMLSANQLEIVHKAAKNYELGLTYPPFNK